MRSTTIALRFALAISALSITPGCSYLFVDGPPPGHTRMQYFDCTTSRAAPVIDSVVAITYGGTGAVSLADEQYRRTQPIAIVAALGIAALGVASAVHGFAKTSECEAAKSAAAERVLSHPSGACGSDVDCKGVRICNAGTCVLP